MKIATFFTKRSYASIAAGSFVIGSKHVNELVEAECFIVYAHSGLGSTFALKNISLSPIDEHSVTVSFDPLTDTHALPVSILPEGITESIELCRLSVEDLKDCPRFGVANDPSGNNPNRLTLDIDCRQRLASYREGLCSLTELVLTLYEKGIHISDIDNSVKQKRNDVALLAQYPKTVLALNKDNGVVQDHMPVLARMSVLM